MYKQSPSDYVIILTHEGYILNLQLLLGLPYTTMWTYPPEKWKILSHVILTSNIDCYPTVLNFTASKYDEYDEYYEWLEQFGSWDGTA